MADAYSTQIRALADAFLAVVDAGTRLHTALIKAFSDDIRKCVAQALYDQFVPGFRRASDNRRRQPGRPGRSGAKRCRAAAAGTLTKAHP